MKTPDSGSRPWPGCPLVVAYGLGVNSTAMLVEFTARGIRPDLILFADTGGEKPETYNYLSVIRPFLARVGFPDVTVVRYRPRTAPYHTLEQQCLLRREGLAGVVAFSDPCRRINRQGMPVFGGHVGTVYQAHNAAYLGRGTPRTLAVLPDGRVFSDRAQQKVRSADRGVVYAVRSLVACGAEPPSSYDSDLLRDWLREWRSRLCRMVRHRGNHKYAWALSRRVRLPRGLPYPKQIDP